MSAEISSPWRQKAPLAARSWSESLTPPMEVHIMFGLRIPSSFRTYHDTYIPLSTDIIVFSAGNNGLNEQSRSSSSGPAQKILQSNVFPNLLGQRRRQRSKENGRPGVPPIRAPAIYWFRYASTALSHIHAHVYTYIYLTLCSVVSVSLLISQRLRPASSRQRRSGPGVRAIVLRRARDGVQPQRVFHGFDPVRSP